MPQTKPSICALGLHPNTQNMTEANNTHAQAKNMGVREQGSDKRGRGCMPIKQGTTIVLNFMVVRKLSCYLKVGVQQKFTLQ